MHSLLYWTAFHSVWFCFLNFFFLNFLNNIHITAVLPSFKTYVNIFFSLFCIKRPACCEYCSYSKILSSFPSVWLVGMSIFSRNKMYSFFLASTQKRSPLIWEIYINIALSGIWIHLHSFRYLEIRQVKKPVEQRAGNLAHSTKTTQFSTT